MNFFEAQESARSRSRRLVLLFVVAVIMIIATIYAVVHFTFGPGPSGTIDWGLLLTVAAGTSLIVGAGSGVRTLQLRQGGARVAEMLGGRRVRTDTSDEAERRLVNVVEEMAIASGTPVPAIYVLDNEGGINAFAAGYSLDDAAVAVTRGTLEHLDRDELQGVIAHEFSHILNGDMRLNIRLIGLLFGILLLAIAGRFLLHSGGGSRRSRDSGGGQIALLGVALVVVGYIGVFFGKLIQSAVSRQREYLADAAAVQFTRNPEGLAGALKKIGGFAGSRIENHHAQEASHLFFASGMRSSMFSLLTTHPPLEDRIRRLDPSFNGIYPVAGLPVNPGARGIGAAAQVSGLAGNTAQGASAWSEAPYVETTGATGASLIASIGSPRWEHVEFASRFLEKLPDSLHTAAHSPDDAVPLLFALLLDDRDAVVYRQHDIIDKAGGASLLSRVTELSPEVSQLGDVSRLPLLDILLPALRELSPEQARRVYRTSEELVEADGRMDVFELALLHVLGRQLRSGELGRASDAAPGKAINSFGPLRAELATVLSAIAWHGAKEDEVAAAQAFAAARAVLSKQAEGMTLKPRHTVSMADVDSALGSLRQASLPIRRLVLQACVDSVSHDGRVSMEEGELLRAVAEAMDLPMPPVV